MPGLSGIRVVAAALLAVLAAASLAACRTNVGTAATVNGERISETSVTDYLSGKPPSSALVQQAKAAGQDLIAARVLVLQYEIEQRLYERTLRRNGGVPTSSQLGSIRDDAVSLLAGNGQPITDAQLRTQFENLGVSRSFVPRFLRTLELEYVVIRRLQLSQRSELSAAVTKAGAEVSASPRYGTWDAAELSLRSTGAAGRPAYLTLQTPAAAAPSGAAGTP